jgi:hypothetical protein
VLEPPAERPERAGGRATEDTRARPGDGDPRLAPLVARLTERLRPVCADWDETRFQAIVLHIARTELRWGDADRRGGSPVD